MQIRSPNHPKRSKNVETFAPPHPPPRPRQRGAQQFPARHYLLAKLLWNPETDVKAHITQFCQAYYGKAGESIIAYVDLMQAQVRGKAVHAHIFDGSTAVYLNDAFLKDAEQVLSRAEDEAGTGEERFRVQVARLPIWYVKLVTNRVAGEERSLLLSRFLEVSRKAGISNISESQALEDWAKKMEQKLAQPRFP